MASPLETPLQEVRGRGRGAERRWGSGKVYFSCHAPPHPPSPYRTGGCPEGCCHGVCSRLPLLPTDWEESPRILSQRSPHSSLCLLSRAVFYLYPFRFP